MIDFLLMSAICVGMVLSTVVLFYELLYRGWAWLDQHLNRPRHSIIMAVLLNFVCHTLAVWMYGIAYWLIVEHAGLGTLHGEHPTTDFFSYIYFSSTTYSSLGFGDIYPHGPVQLLVGVEAINGLLLIGWSVAFTYLATERYYKNGRY